MYAMSVSPLSRSALEKISPELLKSLGGIYKDNEFKNEFSTPREQKLKRPRDFTNNIKIGTEIFEIETVKGKKEVKLPWERLKNIKDQIQKDTASLYKGLRGTILLNGKYSFLKREKLSLILTLLPALNLEDALKNNSALGTKYNSRENLDKLLERLPQIVSPAPLKSKKNDKQPPGKIGFSGLFSDGEGNYLIKCSRSFHTSLNESIASLEALIDELDDEVDVGKKHIVNQCYRRLSDYLN
jgi:hypothetical protein